jgi:hypothetical protein
MLEPNDRTLSTVGGACVEQGLKFGPRTVRAATLSPAYWGRPEGNLAQAYQASFECQVSGTGKCPNFMPICRRGRGSGALNLKS